MKAINQSETKDERWYVGDAIEYVEKVGFYGVDKGRIS